MVFISQEFGQMTVPLVSSIVIFTVELGIYDYTRGWLFWLIRDLDIYKLYKDTFTILFWSANLLTQVYSQKEGYPVSKSKYNVHNLTQTLTIFI